MPTGVVGLVTRNVVLTQHQHELVQRWVESGRYQNASEALRAGLRLLEREEEERLARLAAMQQAVQVGWADITQGRFVDVADGDLDAYLAELGSRARAQQPER